MPNPDISEIWILLGDPIFEFALYAEARKTQICTARPVGHMKPLRIILIWRCGDDCARLSDLVAKALRLTSGHSFVISLQRACVFKFCLARMIAMLVLS